MRTQLKSKEHFDFFIPKQKERTEKFEDAITSGRIGEDRAPEIKRQIFTINLHRLIAKYSAGSPVNEIKVDFGEVITKFERGWKDKGDILEDNIHFDDYVLMLWMLSLGVLLDIELKDFERIVKVLDNSSRKDYLFDYIIASKIPSRVITDKITYPKHYDFLKNLIDSKNVTELKKHLDSKWYKSMETTYWYDNHKSKADTFFGYWSFESGALVKILNLDDSILKGQQYYPSV